MGVSDANKIKERERERERGLLRVLMIGSS